MSQSNTTPAALAEVVPAPPLSRPPPTHTTMGQTPPNAHDIELQVSSALLSQPGWNFSRLVVHRIPGGICLEGVLEADTDCRDEVDSLARRVARVDQVLNQILVHSLTQPHVPR